MLLPPSQWFCKETNSSPILNGYFKNIGCMTEIIQIYLYFKKHQVYDGDNTFFLLQDYNAKISDFGLAKLGPSGGDSHVTTRIMGTYGYAAPEYIATGIDISNKSQKIMEMENYITKSCKFNTPMRPYCPFNLTSVHI